MVVDAVPWQAGCRLGWRPYGAVRSISRSEHHRAGQVSECQSAHMQPLDVMKYSLETARLDDQEASHARSSAPGPCQA